MRDGLIGLLLLAAVALVVFGGFRIHEAVGYIVAGLIALMVAGFLALGKFEHEKPADKSR